MSLSDEQLLDFNPDRLAAFDYEEAWKRLEEHGDVYRAQLVGARCLAGYRRRRLADHQAPPLGFSQDYTDGWDEAMRDVIAHLRQGDFLPGSAWYEDEVEGRLR
jgi:hypothetical protein